MAQKWAAGGKRWARRLVAIALASVIALIGPGVPAKGQQFTGGWDGRRAELFVVGVATPTLMAGGPPGTVTATLINRGPNQANNVRLKYTVPAGLTFISASIEGGACIFSAPTVNCQVPNLRDNQTAAISVVLRAPSGTAGGTKAGSFSSPESDEFNPAGGNLLSLHRSDDWVGTNEGSSLPGRWEPSDPYSDRPPCDITIDIYGRLYLCPPRVFDNVITSPVTSMCNGAFEKCLDTWEFVGTYYAQQSGSIRLCANTMEDGAYVNWSDGFDPATSDGDGLGVHWAARTQQNSSVTPWNSGSWAVTAGQAYRFSIRVANRDDTFTRGRGPGGIGAFGLSTVYGGPETCSFANFWPPTPASVTVATPNASITLAKALGTDRVSSGDQFTVQIKDAGGTVVNSTAASTSAGFGSTVNFGTGTTGTTNVTPGAAYTLTEAAAGADLKNYGQSISCTNSTFGSTTVLPSGKVDLGNPPVVRPAPADAISCVLTNAGVAPTITLRVHAVGPDTAFPFTVTGGPLPADPTVSTVNEFGETTLANTLVGQNVTVTQNTPNGWKLITGVCTNARTGEVLHQPFKLGVADRVICSYTDVTTTLLTAACNLNPVQNPSFASGVANWTISGPWYISDGRMSIFSDAASLATDRVGQTIGAVAPGSSLHLSVVPADGVGGQGGNQGTLEIVYAGVVYARLLTTAASQGFSGNATVTGLNGATIPPTSATVQMGTVKEIAIKLPDAVPVSGVLQFRYGITGSGDTLGVADDIGITGIAVNTAAICLRKQSAGGSGTFTFSSTNLFTNTATPGTFSVTTAAGNNPATVNPVFGLTGTQLVATAPGSTVTITETDTSAFTPTGVSCTNLVTGAAVPQVVLTGATITVPGSVLGREQLLGCVLTDEGRSYTVTKTAGPASTVPGGTVTYTVTVANGGTAPYAGASFSDSLSGVLDDASFVSATASTGTATFTSPNLTWTGDLAGSGTATVTYTVRVNAPDTGDHHLSNVVTTTAAGGNCTATPRPAACVTDTPVADSRLLKTASASSAVPGQTVTYTVTMANSGQVPLAGASFSDDLTAVLDDAVFGTASADVGTVSFTSPTLTWTGNLPVGASAQIVYTVTVRDPDPGDHRLDNILTSTTPGNVCTAGATSPTCRTSTPVAGLRIVKTADVPAVVPGGAVRYTVTVTNTSGTVQSGVLFSDDLTDVLDDATLSGVTFSAGSADFTSPLLKFTGTLAPGQAVTVGYTATVRRPDPGNYRLVNAISSAAPGAGCPAGTEGSVCSVTVPVANLHIVKSVDQTSTAVGGTVMYTMTLTNAGQAPVTAATVTDDLSGVVDDAVVGTPTASTGTVAFTSPTLTWTGNVPAGGTVTVSYPVTVNRPATGDHRLRNLVASTAPAADCPRPGSQPAPGCATDTPIADLKVTKTVDVTSTEPGGLVTYHVSVVNAGQTDYPALSGVDDLSGVLDDADFVSATPSGGTISFNPPYLTWSSTLPVGGAGAASYVLRVKDPDTGDHHLINSVSSTAPGSSCPGGPACVTDTPVADLQVEKSIDVASAVPGQIVTYTVKVTNTGVTPLSGLVGVDDVSGVLDDATFVDAVPSGGSVTFNPPLLTWTGGAVPLPVGVSAGVTYRFRVNDPDTGDHRLINSLSSTNLGSSCPGGPACVTDTPIADLRIDKSADVSVVSPGSPVHYTVTVTNIGQTPMTGAAYTDDLSDVVDDAVISGVGASAGSAVLGGAAITWTGDLAAGANALITYTATVSNPDPGNLLLRNTITSATAGASCPAVFAGTPGCSTSTLVPGFEIAKSVDKATANPGDTVTYTVKLTNFGATDIAGAAISDDLSGILDDAAFGVLTQPTIGTANFSSPHLTWTGTLPTGTSTTIVYTVVVSAGAGDHLMKNVVTSDTAGANCGNASTDPKCSALTLINGLSIVKTADRASAVPGDTVTHTVTVTNTGPTALTGASFTDDLSGVLDDAAFGVLTQPSVGSAAFSAPDVTWTGDLDPGQSTAISYTVVVNGPDNGDHLLTNRVASPTAGADCPAGTTNANCATITRVSEIRITKAPSVSSAVLGQSVSYTVTVSNAGAGRVDARFTDNLSGVLDDASYVSATASTGSVTFAAPTLTWNGILNIGASATVTYTVRVNNPDQGDAGLANTITSTTPGVTCVTCVTNTPISRVSIVKTAGSPDVLPGGQVGYTIVFTNTGQVALPNADLTDDLSGIIDDAVVSNVAATTGTAIFTPPNLTWSGSLAPGAAATITYTATVNSPDAGDKRLANTVTSTSSGNNCPCGTDTPIGGIAIVKLTDKPSVAAGGVVQYFVRISNTGQYPVTAATFTDDITGLLDDATVDAPTATSGNASRTGSAITWTGDLPVGSFAVVLYRATVRLPDTGDHHLGNLVVSPTPGSNCPAGSSSPACRTDTPVGELTLAKSGSPAVAAPGMAASYTVTVSNVGQTDLTGASFVDDLTGVLDDAAFTSSSATTGTAGFAAPNLTWTGDLGIGQTATVTYTVTVNNPTLGDGSLHNSVTSPTAGSTCPAGCVVTTPVSGTQVTKASDHSSAVPGDTVTYTVTLTNTGRAALTGTSFIDNLSDVIDDATFGTISVSSGAASFTSPSLTWTGDLPLGGVVTVTYTVVVDTPDTGDHMLVNGVVAPLPGSNCTAGRSEPLICTISTPVASLAITKTAAPVSATPGTDVTYTVAVQNSGRTPQTGLLFTDDLSAVLDDADFGGVTATTGSTSFTTPVLSYAGTLLPGDSATVTYVMRVRRPDTGDHHLRNVLTSAAPGAACPATVPCRTDTPVAELAITKTLDQAKVAPGDSISYTVVVRNTGVTVLNGATFTDDLTGVLDDAVFTGSTASVGSAVLTPPALTWTGDLLPGAQAVVTYALAVRQPNPGDHRLVNAIVSGTAGSQCTAAAPCTTDNAVDGLDIAETPDRPSAAPGDVVTWTITVHNSGQTPYPAATVIEDLTGVLDDAAFVAAQADTGSVSFTAPMLTWAGALDIGATATITYQAEVGHTAIARSTSRLHLAAARIGPGDHSLDTSVASTSAGANCTVAAPCITATPISELSIVKSAAPASASIGSTVDYQLTVTNLGLSAYTQTSVVDVLTGVLDDAAFVSANATSGTTSFAAPTLTWTGDVPVAGSVTITYQVKVNAPDTGDHLLANSVTSAAAGSSCVATAPCTTATPVSDLLIVKTASAASVPAGGSITYTVAVTNQGQTDLPAAAFTDDLTGVLDDADFTSAQATSGTASFVAPMLTWSGSLPINASALITYTVTAHNPVDGDGTLVNSVTSPTGAVCTAVAPCTTSTPVTGLSLVKTVDRTTANPGETVTYQLTVTNTGKTPIVGAVVADDLADVLDDASFNTVATDHATAVFGSDTVTWTGDLAAGESATIRYSVTVHSPDRGNHLLVNRYASGTPGADCDLGSSCVTTTPVHELSIAKSMTSPLRRLGVPAGGSAGEVERYSIAIQNAGQVDEPAASVTDDLSGILDDAKLLGFTATSGTVDVTGATLTWTGSLPVGASATVVFDVQVDAPVLGDNLLINRVTGSSPLSNCPADLIACRVITPVEEWTISKSASRTTVPEGEQVIFTVKVVNTGLAPINAAAFTDDLTDVLDDGVVGTPTASTGAAVLNPPNLTWVGEVPVGGSATISYPVTAHLPDPGNRTMANSVTTIPGGTCAICAVTVQVTPGASPTAAPPTTEPPLGNPMQPMPPSAGPVTGVSIPTLLRYAGILLGLGSLALLLGRRRRTAGSES